MLDFVILLATIGAAARLTRLAVTDTITEQPRTAILTRIAHPRHLRARAAQGHDIPPPTPARAWTLDLLTCHWCLGFWISLALVLALLTIGHHPAYQIPALTLAVSYAVGWLADNERE